VPCLSWEHSSDGVTAVGGGGVTFGRAKLHVTYGIHEVAETQDSLASEGLCRVGTEAYRSRPVSWEGT